MNGTVKVLLVTLGCYSLAVLGMLLMAADVVGLDRYEEGAFHPTAVGATASLGLVMSLARVLTGGDRFDRNWALALAPVCSVAARPAARASATNASTSPRAPGSALNWPTRGSPTVPSGAASCIRAASS